MVGISLAQAEAQLAAWLQASLDIAEGQEVKISDRTFTLADASVVTDRISYWEEKIQRLSRGGGMRVRGATPV